jgi:hypothetical protein
VVVHLRQVLARVALPYYTSNKHANLHRRVILVPHFPTFQKLCMVFHFHFFIHYQLIILRSDPSGALNFNGKAVLHAAGVNFSNGASFAINMDQLQLDEELGKGNYGTVKKVLHKPTNVAMAMKVQLFFSLLVSFFDLNNRKYA